MKSGFKKWISNFLEGSAIIRGLKKASDYVYNKLGNGIYSFMFANYDSMNETFDNGAIGSLQDRKRGKFSNFFTKSVEESVYVNTVSKMMKCLSYLSMRVFGIFLISSGFYTVLAQMMMYLIYESETSIRYGIYAIALILLGIPMLFSGRAFCHVLYNSKVFGGFIRHICGFKDRDFDFDRKPTGRINVAFILGLPFGILTCSVNPLYIILGMVILAFAYIIMVTPECGYNLALFTLPFLIVLPHPSILLALLTAYTFMCYVIKLIMGKRYFRMELIDVLVLCFMAVLLLGGIVSYGGLQSLMVASIFVTLMLGYFLTVGLVNNKENLKKTVAILTTSMIFVAAYGLFQNYTGNISAEWIDTSMFDSISGRVVSTFENPNMLGEYLILLLPMVLASVIGEKGWIKKTGYVISFVAGGACLIYTWARGAWLGFIFAFVIFLLIWNRKSMVVMFAAAAASPLMIPYLPQSIVSRFSSIGDLSDTSTNYRVYIWRGSVNMASDYALSGIGIGEKAFDRIYPYYSFAGIEKAPHAHNLFLQLFIEVGIFGFIVFLAMMICLMQNGFSLAKNGEDKAVRFIGCGALCGVIAALVQGMTDYIWYNYRVFFVFWIVIGLVAVARRVDYNMRKSKKQTSDETSVDITI